MSIFTTISNTAGSLFSGFKQGLSNIGSQVSNAYTGIFGAPSAPNNWMTNPSAATGNTYNPAAPQVTGYGDNGVKYYGGYQPQMGSYSPVSTGQVQGPQMYQPVYGVGGGGSYSNQGGGVSSTPVLSDTSAKSYAKGANVGNLDLNGMTYEQADKAIQAKKGEQMGQNTALTSAVFNPDAISKTTKKIQDMGLTLNSINNNSWLSMGSKQDQISNLLKTTAKDLATDYNTPEEMAAAYHNDPNAQKALDAFAQAGGSDQMLIDAVKEKNVSKTPNNMSTADYIGSIQQQTNDQTVNNLVASDPLIKAEIARTANIPNNLKDLYLGDEGLYKKRVDLAQENINLLKEKIADEKVTAREQANYYIEKNNAELSVAKNTIEQNRINAKNYLTGMLAKLGALQTTSAAAEGVSTLDQKYQQQSADAESKVKFANQDIELKLRDTVRKIDSSGEDKIQSIKEDLSKDQETIIKEISKAKLDSDKRIFDLTLKANDRMTKNIKSYTESQQKLAEDWTTQFNNLVSGGIDVGKAAASVNVKLPVADQKISTAARIKDPNAISYFKSLPKGFQNEWIQFSSTQPQGTFFTLADLQYNYEPYRLQEQQKVTTKSSGASTRTP